MARSAAVTGQDWSAVDYDPTLTDPFFESNEWSDPWWIIKHLDGHFEDTTCAQRPEKEPPHVKQTAKGISARLHKHLMPFCEARVRDANAVSGERPLPLECSGEFGSRWSSTRAMPRGYGAFSSFVVVGPKTMAVQYVTELKKQIEALQRLHTRDSAPLKGAETPLAQETEDGRKTT